MERPNIMLTGFRLKIDQGVGQGQRVRVVLQGDWSRICPGVVLALANALVLNGSEVVARRSLNRGE